MRAVAITIGCGLALCAGLLTIVAAQNPPAQTPPAAPAPPETLFERQWNHTISAPGQLAIAASPHRVFVSDDETGVEARLVSDGAVAWQVALPSDLPVAVAGEQIYVASAQQIHALQEATGHTRWTRPLDSPTVAVIAHGAGALTASGRTVRAWSADGNILWERSLLVDVGAELLAVDETQVYVGLTDLTLVALDGASGAVRWTKRIGTLPRAFTAVAGKVYFGGTDGHFHAYDRNGGHDWTYHREDVIGAPAVDARHVYVALWDNTVVAHSKDGRLQWRKSVDERPTRGPILSGADIVLVLRSDALVVMSTTPTKPAPARGGPPVPAPSAAPAAALSRNTVKVATPSADGSQVFAVIQLENQVRVVVAYKRS